MQHQLHLGPGLFTQYQSSLPSPYLGALEVPHWGAHHNCSCHPLCLSRQIS